MTTNMKTILAAMGAAALLASPVAAKPRHSHALSAEAISSNAQGSAVFHRPYGAPRYGVGNEGGPYTPSIPTPPHGRNPDFQDDARGS